MRLAELPVLCTALGIGRRSSHPVTPTTLTPSPPPQTPPSRGTLHEDPFSIELIELSKLLAQQCAGCVVVVLLDNVSGSMRTNLESRNVDSGIQHVSALDENLTRSLSEPRHHTNCVLTDGKGVLRVTDENRDLLVSTRIFD